MFDSDRFKQNTETLKKLFTGQKQRQKRIQIAFDHHVQDTASNYSQQSHEVKMAPGLPFDPELARKHHLIEAGGADVWFPYEPYQI